MSVQRFLLLAIAATTATAAATPERPGPKAKCRVLPGDSNWPSSSEWAKLNRTINGNLIASVPLASVCHNGPFNAFNAGACAQIQNTWNQTTLQRINSPAEFMNMYFGNYSCDPFTPTSQPCTLGNHVSYVIKVTKAEDVQAGIAFAKKNNVRIVIKNTGHDYLGKSTGKGGLSLWTHNLKSTQYLPNYKSSYYKGPAIKLGAGVEGFEAYAAANAVGKRVVGGSCPTVGIAGGWAQGGGHSTLSSTYGMGADQVLEWEVVTVDGQHLVATPEKNSDLYWAMSGGGGGNYAVAISMTARLHSDGIVGGAAILFNDTKVGNDVFWEAIGSFHALLPPFVDAGHSATYTISEHDFTSWGVTMPGADLAMVNQLMEPFLTNLTAYGIEYNYMPHVSASYYEHYNFYFGPLPQGFSDYAPFTGSRILPRSMFTNPRENKIVTGALRNASALVTSGGWFQLACQALNTTRTPHPDNALLPAWRDALSVCLTPGKWDPTATPDAMAARQNHAANVLQPMLDKATPGGGVYLNEANYRQQNWQKEFYGANYARLSQIKRKYDPEGLLYVHTGVGSEAWYEDANNRLCQA